MDCARLQPHGQGDLRPDGKQAINLRPAAPTAPAACAAAPQTDKSAGTGLAGRYSPHRRQAVYQLGVQRAQEVGEQLGAGSQRCIVTPKHEAEEGLPLGKALQRLAQQEGQEGELELPCGATQAGHSGVVG